MDYDGLPIRYDALKVLENVVARHKSVRFDLEAVHDGTSWRRAHSSVDVEEDLLNDGFREQLAGSARAVREDTFVRAGDPHLDATRLRCVVRADARATRGRHAT